MFKLVLSRLALAVPQLILLSLFAFLLTYLVPGSPAAAILGPSATPDSVAQLETQLGLDRPFFERLGEFYAGVLHADFGTSYSSGRPVTELYAERLPATISLMIGGLVVAVLLGLALGLIGGTKPSSIRDRIATAVTSFTMSVPEFWIGIVLLLVFAVQLGWVPVIAYVPFGHDPVAWLRGLILPSIALGIAGAALIARQTRTAMAETLSARYVNTLVAAGVSRQRMVFHYGFKNARVPILASTGITVSIMLGASFAIEKVYAFPGIGSLLLRSVTAKDFAVLQGGVLLVATMIILVNLLLDISYGLIDPKSRPQ